MPPSGGALAPPSAAKPGDSLDVTIEKGIYRGLGLARHEGRVVLVSRGLPGERLRVRVDAVTPGFLRASPQQVLQAAAERRPSPCSYVPACGGCVYQDLDYASQLRLKESILRESLQRAGVAWEAPIPVVASPEEGWRSRATFHLRNRDGVLRLGLYEEGSRRVVDLERCLQLSPAMNRAARALLQALREAPDVARRVRDVRLAESFDGSRLVAALGADLEPREALRLGQALDGTPWLTGLGVVAGSGRGSRFLTLRGEPYVEAAVLGIRFRTHIRSFFQANRFLAEPLAREVLDRVPPGGSILDLYAGAGLFALPLAARGDRVLGLEISPSAVDDAAWAARAAGMHNVRVEPGDVLERLRSGPRPDADERVVVDPPRTGLPAEVVDRLVQRRPLTLTYVSCDPPTLGRDLKRLDAGGYRLRSLRALDVFPDTLHLEAVAHLTP